MWNPNNGVISVVDGIGGGDKVGIDVESGESENVQPGSPDTRPT